MGQWHEMGRTEVIKDNLNPEWQKKFVVNYSFEERQEIKIDVYDQGKKNNLNVLLKFNNG